MIIQYYIPLEDAVAMIDGPQKREGLHVHGYTPQQMQAYLTPFLLERIGMSMKMVKVITHASYYGCRFKLEGRGNFSNNTPIEVYGVILNLLLSPVSLKDYSKIMMGLVRAEHGQNLPEEAIHDYPPEIEAYLIQFFNSLGKIKYAGIPNGLKYVDKVIEHARAVLGDEPTFRERLDYFIAFLFSDFALAEERWHVSKGKTLIYSEISSACMDVDSVIDTMPKTPLQRDEMALDADDNGIVTINCGDYTVVMAHGEFRGSLHTLLREYQANGGRLQFSFAEDPNLNSHNLIHANTQNEAVININRIYGDGRPESQSCDITAHSFKPGLYDTIKDIVTKTPFKPTAFESDGRDLINPKKIVAQSQRHAMASQYGRRIYTLNPL